MEHGARLSTTRVIALGYICLGTVTTLSLTTNIIQGINNYRLQTEQKVAVTPMLFGAPFAVSQNQSDASYIEQLGLSFIALRPACAVAEICIPGVAERTQGSAG